MFSIGLTDHLEAPRQRSSIEVFAEVAEFVELADRLGVRYAWFAEHHAHAHQGHLPTPLLLALHLAGATRQIRLGTAIICLNLHQPLDVAESVAVADVLSGGRMAIGFGSGSTPQEAELFGCREMDEHQRHAHFEASLRAIIAAWEGGEILPIPSPDLHARCWIAANSIGAARIAGSLGFNMLFSHLRTPAQYREYRAAYQSAGGDGLIAANRPVFVGPDDATAFGLAEPALRTLWRRFQAEGKIPAAMAEPKLAIELCAHPINFIVGGPESVARQLGDLHRLVPFDVANVELRWPGLSREHIHKSLRLLMERVLSLCRN